jgi:hypothetical protein
MCCGSRRSAWRAASTSAFAPRAAQTPSPAVPGPAPSAPANFGPSGPGVTLIKLRYADSAPIRLRGPITGRAYDFSGAEPVQAVDVRDAAIFVRSARLRLSAL